MNARTHARQIDDLLATKQLRSGDVVGRRRAAGRWSLDGIAGRLVEISEGDASASLTAACGLVCDAQLRSETVVWITPADSCFFPPDASEGGVDLHTLAIVRVPGHGVLKAADKLARSGAFGLIVIDLNLEGSFVSTAVQSRLLGFAREYHIGIVFLTKKRSGQASLGSLISLRGEASRTRIGPERYRVQVRILKDKQRAPGWSHGETCRGPAGLR